MSPFWRSKACRRRDSWFVIRKWPHRLKTSGIDFQDAAVSPIQIPKSEIRNSPAPGVELCGRERCRPNFCIELFEDMAAGRLEWRFTFLRAEIDIAQDNRAVGLELDRAGQVGIVGNEIAARHGHGQFVGRRIQ